MTKKHTKHKKHTKYKKHLIGAAVIALLAASAFTAYINLHSKTHQVTPQIAITASSKCDASLWQHLYNFKRLHIINQCVTVTGIIDRIDHKPDGDFHIRLKLDSAYSSMLNKKNNSVQGGDLVIEPICETKPTQIDAISACRNYQSNVIVPTVGTRVQVVGAYVLDNIHGWNEIHPVTSVTVLK